MSEYKYGTNIYKDECLENISEDNLKFLIFELSWYDCK